MWLVEKDPANPLQDRLRSMQEKVLLTARLAVLLQSITGICGFVCAGKNDKPTPTPARFFFFFVDVYTTCSFVTSEILNVIFPYICCTLKPHTIHFSTWHSRIISSTLYNIYHTVPLWPNSSFQSVSSEGWSSLGEATFWKSPSCSSSPAFCSHFN